MTVNSKTAARMRAARHRCETMARKRAERDACAVWRPCLCCGRPFPSEGIHNRLCIRCHRSTRNVGAFDVRALRMPRGPLDPLAR